MNRRQRKFLGTIIMLVFVVVYALVVMGIATPMLMGASKLVEGLFYLIAGIAWAPPLMVLIKWMEDRREGEA